MKLSKDKNLIHDVNDWFAFAPPLGRQRQWVDGRSAKELAKAFCASGSVHPPSELVSLLNSNPALGDVEWVEGWPECVIRLDGYRGGTRNADLAVLGQSSQGAVAVTIEAKADEPFDRAISQVLARAKVKVNSNLPNRVENLVQSLFNNGSSAIPDVKYQLLTGAAATLIFAKKIKAHAAVFIVYEFGGSSCSPIKMQCNADDLLRFLSLLTGSQGTLVPSQLTGPFTVPGSENVPGNIPLYIGKATR